MVDLLLHRLLPAIDRLGRWLAYVAMIMTVVMITVTMQEVIRRKGLNAPTMWANDITYMLNGALFIMGAGYTLHVNGHVRIDFMSVQLPLRLQHAINLLFYMTLFLPALSIICWMGVTRSWNAFQSGQIETMSAWEPVIWPFYTAITVGLIGLLLQTGAEAVRHAVGIIDPGRVPGPSEKHAQESVQ